MPRTVSKLILALLASVATMGSVLAMETKPLPSYREALPSAPSKSNGYAERGVAYCLAGAWDNAIIELDHATQLDPGNATAILYRACAYRGKGAFEQSIRDWNQYLLLNPTNDFAYKSRASVYNVTGDFDKAIEDWNEGLRLNPKDATALAMRGFAHAKKGQYDGAVADYTNALQLDPTNHSACNGLGWLRATCPVAAVRNGKEAVKEATRACDLTGWTDWTRIDTLAAAFAETGQFKKAVEHQERAMGMSGPTRDDLRAMRQRLSLYQQRQSYHEVQQ
jgi:tetratricopeptide (TPR) repeat protein